MTDDPVNMKIPLYIRTEAEEKPSCKGGREIAENLRKVSTSTVYKAS